MEKEVEVETVLTAESVSIFKKIRLFDAMRKTLKEERETNTRNKWKIMELQKDIKELVHELDSKDLIIDEMLREMKELKKNKKPKKGDK